MHKQTARRHASYKGNLKATLQGNTSTHKRNKIIFASFSKRNLYLRSDVSTFVLLQGETPINPYMNFEYNLSWLVDQNLIRIANNTLLKEADELWVFGEVSDGVLVEIYLAKKQGIPVRFFRYDPVAHSFHEIDITNVVLEDVSSWAWEYVLAGKNIERWHPRLRFTKTYPLVYPAYSKHNFYLHMHISKYCLEKKTVPLNPFMLFAYFLGDRVPRERVYQANANIIRISDRFWTFGEVSDGVLAELLQKKQLGGEVRYHKITDTHPISFRKILPAAVEFEVGDGDLEGFRERL